MGGEFLGGEFFWGPLLLEKTESKDSGPKFGRPKFVSQNSALNSGSGGVKSPVQKVISHTFVRWHQKISAELIPTELKSVSVSLLHK